MISFRVILISDAGDCEFLYFDFPSISNNSLKSLLKSTLTSYSHSLFFSRKPSISSFPYIDIVKTYLIQASCYSKNLQKLARTSFIKRCLSRLHFLTLLRVCSTNISSYTPQTKYSLYFEENTLAASILLPDACRYNTHHKFININFAFSIGPRCFIYNFCIHINPFATNINIVNIYIVIIHQLLLLLNIFLGYKHSLHLFVTQKPFSVFFLHISLELFVAPIYTDSGFHDMTVYTEYQRFRI